MSEMEMAAGQYGPDEGCEMMHPRALVPVACAALFVAHGSARARVVEIDWDPAMQFEQRLDVEAGGFAEVCGRLKSGSRVAWRFQASAPTSFNVHFHEGKRVFFAAKQEGTSQSSAVLEARSEQDYCWMWSNKTAEPISVQVRMNRQR